MPRLFFNLSTPDQNFQDQIGAQVSDLAAGHARAVRFASHVMTFCRLADNVPDFRRWQVQVVDEEQRTIMTVIFPSQAAVQKPTPPDTSTLASRLEAVVASIQRGSTELC